MFAVWFCNGKRSPIASSLSFPILSLSVDVVQWPACRKLQTWWCSRREECSATWEYSHSDIYALTSGWKMGNMMRGAKNDMVNPDNGDSSLKGKITKVTSFVCFFFNCSTHICITVTSVFKKCDIISWHLTKTISNTLWGLVLDIFWYSFKSWCLSSSIRPCLLTL